MGRFLLKKTSHKETVCFQIPKGVSKKDLSSLRRTTPRLKGTRLVIAKSNTKAIQKFLNKKIMFKRR